MNDGATKRQEYTPIEPIMKGGKKREGKMGTQEHILNRLRPRKLSGAKYEPNVRKRRSKQRKTNHKRSLQPKKRKSTNNPSQYCGDDNNSVNCVSSSSMKDYVNTGSKEYDIRLKDTETTFDDGVKMKETKIVNKSVEQRTSEEWECSDGDNRVVCDEEIKQVMKNDEETLTPHVPKLRRTCALRILLHCDVVKIDTSDLTIIDEDNAIQEDSEYPLPSTNYQKMQRQLARQKQLDEMRAREAAWAREERLLRRQGLSKSPEKSGRCHITWKDEKDLVEIFCYSPCSSSRGSTLDPEDIPDIT